MGFFAYSTTVIFWLNFLGGGGGRGGAYSRGIWNEGQQIIGGVQKLHRKEN